VDASSSNFDVEDLFKLQKMAFIVEIALAKARKDDSEIRIRDKQDLFHALNDRDTLIRILQSDRIHYIQESFDTFYLRNTV
jgi:hypothetical protein